MVYESTYLGNMKNGGIEFPVADTAQANVTSTPLSAETTAPTCFCPRRETNFPHGMTVVKPVSFCCGLAARIVPGSSGRGTPVSSPVSQAREGSWVEPRDPVGPKRAFNML
ncbi:hypothetical protein OUZ56_005927 [Daphnia magna]|uniref:Uncharacterized protein n=1 Tax=Daphnia magna TaxID=35525 RepID=A0ABQ9YU54_9CRUS|nr:hypothetical protein OUZ56_005927 [Daphnia magna]